MILIDTQKEEFSKLKDIRVFGKISHEGRFNRNLLVVGLGGLGSRTVCALKGMLADDITYEDNIHFLMIDSDISEMETTIENSKEGIGFNALEVISIYRPEIENVLQNGIASNPIHENLANWMDPEFPAITIGRNGAKGNRQIGRLMFSNSYMDVRMLLFDKLQELHDRTNEGMCDVIVVCGVAGGTGSGILSDVTYNIRAYGKAKKWNNLRIGGCLLMPNVLYGHKSIYEDSELVDRLNANGCATMKEVDYYMKLSEKDDNYTFISKTNKMVIRENLFDACMLVSGKKDSQGYLPEGFIVKDTASFLYRLASNKYIGNNDVDNNRKLLRDVFFENEDYAITNWKMEHDDSSIKTSNCYYKVVSEADYHIPIREIENMCEYDIFSQAYKGLFRSPFKEGNAEADIKTALSELAGFLNDEPGDEIKLNVSGLIQYGQLTKPTYKMIKKNTDGVREFFARKMDDFEKELPVMVKSMKNKLWSMLDGVILRYMREFGPYGAIDIIGAPSAGVADSTKGMIAEVKKLEQKMKDYTPTGEFTRIIDSIKEIVAKRFFTFPSAKRETENGYFDACIKEALAAERSKLIDELDAQDLFGDTLRWLTQRAERLDEIYSQFGEDLKSSIENLSIDGSRTVANIIKKAERHEFLPSDYVTEKRITEVRNGIVKLMLDNESNIDNGRVIPVKDEMEKIYRELFSGVGAYGPEKMFTVAFSEKKLTEQDINVMFGSPVNDRRTDIMEKAARAFVDDIEEEQPLCQLKEGYKNKLLAKKYISVPNVMPYFSRAVKAILISPPYNEKEDSITLNPGEIEISIDDIFVGVPVSMLECAMEMQLSYNSVYDYKGLHIDEVNKDMKSFPDFVVI
ncbi:MAG: tubulin-like doman-containing protein [Coprococcus sp.]|nr:tubulin-like doman-containing protein [Coprococcus sp.]